MLVALPCAVLLGLRFSLFECSYKSSSSQRGNYVLTDVATGKTAASGTFDFVPHWRPTQVSGVAVSHVRGGDEVELVVSNDRSRAVRFRMNCTDSGKKRASA